MTATRAISAAPPFAIRVWSDGLLLFAELPAVAGGQPHIVTESMTESGLWKMLNLLRVRAKENPYASSRVKDELVVRKVGKIEQPMSQAQRNAAADVLKKLGMI